MYAQPSEMGARSYMYGSSSVADTRPVHRNQRSGHKLPKRRKYNESRVSNKSATSYGSYGSYGSYNSSELNNTRRRIEYREGYKKKKKTSICTPCCLGVLGLLLLLALLAGLYFLIRAASANNSPQADTRSDRPTIDYIGTRSTADRETGQWQQDQ